MGLFARIPVGVYWVAFCFVGLVCILSGLPSRIVQLRTARALELQAGARWQEALASASGEPAKLGFQS